MLKKILFSLALLYTFLGFVVLPIVLESQLVKAVEQETDAKLSIEDVYFNPFNFKTVIEGISLKDLNNKELLFLRSLTVDLEPHSLFRAALHVKSILLQKPVISLVHESDGSINFAKILKKTKKEAKQQEKEGSGTAPRIICDLVAVEDASLKYEDYTKAEKFEVVLSPLGFKLENIDTKDFASSDAELRFHTALTDGGSISFKSRIMSLKPFKVGGDIELDGIKLYTNWRYFQDMTGVEVADGVLFLKADYGLGLDDINSSKIENISLDVKNLRVKPKSKNQDILNMNSFYVKGASVEPFRQKVHVKNVGLDGMHIKARRDKQGNIDWQGYLKPANNAQETAKAEQNNTEQSVPWDVAISDTNLKKISLEFEDDSVSPSVPSRVDELNIGIKDVTLAGEKPFAYDIYLRFNDKAACSAKGNMTHSVAEADANLTCQNIDIARYAPYIDAAAVSKLAVYDISLESLSAGFDINAHIKSTQEQTDLYVKDSAVYLDGLLLNKREAKSALAGFKRFKAGGISLDSRAKNISVDEVLLDSPFVNIKRDENGALDVLALIVPKETEDSSKTAVKSEDEEASDPYRAVVRSFKISSAKADFDDAAVTGGSKSSLDMIELHAKNIDSAEKRPFKYDMSFRVNGGGTVKSGGELQHTPLEQKGSIKISALSLKELTPYLQESSYLELREGYFNLDARTSYKQKKPEDEIDVKGSMSLEKFSLYSSADASKVASLAKVKIDSFGFKSAPAALNINEIEVQKFFVDAAIDENKNMNLAKLLKEDNAEADKSKEDKSEEDAKEKKGLALDIAKVKLVDSEAIFADHSLPIDFKTSIHGINGGIYSISNTPGKVSSVDVDGVVDEYGSMKLKGSLDASNVKSLLDVDLGFQNLQLSSVSGYSAQFAGYKIEEGRLFLDLKYLIKESKLQSSNSIVIKNIKLGDEVSGEGISSLPLGFAIALLEDKDGLIDIDLPIQGDIDNPDFKYGAIVVKTLANLIVKAVASPFKFLGQAMGIEGDELKYVEFAHGGYEILPPQKEKLDKISEILQKKPKLGIAVIGGYAREKDAGALALQRVKQKAFAIAKEEYLSSAVLEKIYIQQAQKEPLDAIKKELRKKSSKESFDEEYRKELLLRCTGYEVISEKELLSLADMRREAVKSYLVQKSVEPNRVQEKQSVEIAASSSQEMPKSEMQIELRE